MIADHKLISISAAEIRTLYLFRKKTAAAYDQWYQSHVSPIKE
jgi:hypothetical protein